MLVAVLAAAVLVVGCSADEPDTVALDPAPTDGAATDASPDDPDPTDEVDDDADADRDATQAEPLERAAVVELLDEGEAPGTLRFAYEPGTTSSATFTFEMSMTRFVFDGDEAPASPAIPIEMDTELEIVQVHDGVAEVAFRFTDPRVGADADLDEGLREELRTELSALDGAAGSYRVDDRGVVVDGDLEVDTDDPTLSQLGDELAGMSVPLPEEPVGVGGRWTVRQVSEVGGFATEQLATVELVARDGDVLQLEMRIEGGSPQGTVELPGLDGVGVEVLRSDLSGSGTSELTLREPLPLRASSTVVADQVLEIAEGGRTVPLEQTLEIAMTLLRR